MAALGIFPLLIAIRDRGFWAYLFSHPGAFNAGSLRTIASHDLAPLACAALLGVLAWGAGRSILEWLLPGGVDATFPGLGGCLAFALGLGAMACGTFLLGLERALNTMGMAGLGIAILALSMPTWRALPHVRLPGLSSLRRAPWWRALMAGILGYAAWHVAIDALSPPTDWDSLAYHLAIPKIYLSRGRMVELPWLLQSHWPHLLETLYSVPLAAGMDGLAALLHAMAWGALALAVFRVGRGMLGEGAAWAAATLLAVQPVMLEIAGTPHDDCALALFHFLAAVSAWSWSESGDRRRLVLAGLLSGLGAATKLYGAWLTAILAGWLLLRALSGRRGGWKDALVFLGPAAAVAGPWYLRTWIETGNPVWPYFWRVFGGRWGPESVESGLLWYDWLHSWKGISILRIPLNYEPEYLLVPFGVTAFLAWRQGKTPPRFLLFLLAQAVFFVIPLAGHNEAWRFFMPMMPGLALSAAWAASSLAREDVWGALAALSLAAGMTPVLAATENNKLFAVAGLSSALEPGRDPRALYLERSFDPFEFYESVNRKLRPPSKVLLFREIRGYYLDVDYVWGDPKNQGIFAYQQMKSPEDLGPALARWGVTHVLVNGGLGIYRDPAYYDPHTVEIVEGFLKAHAKRVLGDGTLSLYKIGT